MKSKVRHKTGIVGVDKQDILLRSSKVAKKLSCIHEIRFVTFVFPLRMKVSSKNHALKSEVNRTITPIDICLRTL